jgi:hypothetical protein
MFVQIIQAKVKDADGVRNAMESWNSEVGPKAQGWLGTTAGVTTDGQLVAVARFESEEIAMKNSDSPEQSKWWENFSQNLDGEASFFNSNGVSLSGTGGSDNAGFVQVMQGKVNDIEKARALDARMEQEMPNKRPDVIGSLTAYQDDGTFYSVIYFTSMEEARQGEKEMTENPPPEMEEWGQLMAGEMKFYDLEEPVLGSP